MLNELFGFIFSGNIEGIPTIIVMIIPFIIGLIISFLIKKFFKIIIYVSLITIVFSYLGFFTINLSSLKNIADAYGPEVIHYGTMLIGILPIGLGFFAGLVVGFIFG
jgi:uncharacterized membrane protein (Fun14 family)